LDRHKLSTRRQQRNLKILKTGTFFSFTAADLEFKGIDDIKEIPGELIYGICSTTTGEIIIAGGGFWLRWPAMILLYVGHEYQHSLQLVGNHRFDERQANAFAVRALDLFIQNQEGL